MLNEFKNGILFTAIGKYSNVIIQLVVNAILSRILTPEDYGIVAVVNVFLIFFQMLADFGIGPAIIQSKDLTEKDIQDIFSSMTIFSVVLGLLFMLLGYPISLFYDNTVYIPVTVVLAICVVFYTWLVVPQAVIQKAKNFKLINIVLIGSNFLSGVISIVAAFLGASYYSLIIGNIIKAAFLFVMFFSKSGLSFGWKMNLNPLKKIYDFSKNQFLFNFINYFSRNLDKILIGARLSPSALAFYDKSYQLSLYPNQVLTNVITPVVQPIMSAYEQDKERIEKVYMQITKILGLLGMPLTVFLMFAAEDVIIFMFGQQWYGSVPTFRILAMSIWIQMISSSNGAIFQSANRTDLLLKSGIITSIVNVTSIVVGIMIGNIEAVALLLVFAFTANFFINNYLLMYVMFDSSFKRLFLQLKNPAIIAAMELLVFFFIPFFDFGVFWNVIVKGLIFVAVFFIGLVVTGEFKLLKTVMKKQ